MGGIDTGKVGERRRPTNYPELMHLGSEQMGRVKVEDIAPMQSL
jgi:hypothetical protein